MKHLKKVQKVREFFWGRRVELMQEVLLFHQIYLICKNKSFG